MNPKLRGKSRSAPIRCPTEPCVLVLRNCQRDRRLDGRLLRQIALAALAELGVRGELGVHLVSSPRQAQMNWLFLRHEGSTDVITFDHGSTPDRLHGELFISVADAVQHAVRFQTTWPQEVVRYVVHGLLHLRGFDDRTPAARRRMKRAENRLVRRLARRFALGELARPG